MQGMNNIKIRSNINKLIYSLKLINSSRCFFEELGKRIQALASILVPAFN